MSVTWLYDPATGAYYNKCQHGRACFFCSQCFPLDAALAGASEAIGRVIRENMPDEPGWDANGAPV